MKDDQYLKKLDEILKLPDEESLKELAKLPQVDIWENYKKPEPDPDAWKYRVNGYEDYLTPRTIINPRYLEQYEPEKEKEFSEENKALESLMRKDPTALIPPEKKRLVILLRAQGMSINEICGHVEWSKPTVIKTIRQYANDISKLKRTELEELLQAYSLTLKKRIHTYGIILGTLITELQTRNLMDVPTDRLIDLILRCQKAIGDDILAKIAAESDPESKLGKAGLF